MTFNTHSPVVPMRPPAGRLFPSEVGMPLIPPTDDELMGAITSEGGFAVLGVATIDVRRDEIGDCQSRKEWQLADGGMWRNIHVDVATGSFFYKKLDDRHYYAESDRHPGVVAILVD